MSRAPALHAADSRSAWARLAVVLPSAQAEYRVARAEASSPYTLMMVGFGLGGIAMGKLADRFGVTVVVLIGALGLGAGFIVAGMASSLVGFALAHGVLMGALGSAPIFAP